MFAPVCTRLRTYALPMPHLTHDYIGRVVTAPGVKAWIVDALEEQDFFAEDEPYRKHR